MQHDLQLRAAVRAHYLYHHPFGPISFDEAERKRTPAYRKAVEAAREESLEVEDLLARHRQLALI